MRLARIENELKEINKAIVALARVEERLITVFKRMETFDEEQRRIAGRLTEVEQSAGNNGQSLRFAERVFWIILAAGVTYVFKQNGG